MSEKQTEVLVVDDEKDLVDTYEFWLQNHYSVKKAYSGEEALPKVDEDTDVVLLDRLMPGMSGREVLEEIRERGHDCRVCMVTAVDPDFDIIDMGFDKYIVKPIVKDNLHDAIQELEDRNQYDEDTRKLFSLISKKTVLEQRKPNSVLKDHDEYQELVKETQELQDRIDEFVEDMTTDDFKAMMRDLTASRI